MLAKKGAKRRPSGPNGWVVLAGLGLAFLCVNFAVQVFRKPTELLRFAGLGGAKSPRETWEEFGGDCRRHATDVITADFLAALIQVESSGDSFASPAWAWRWSLSPWEWYGPPSSAVGLLQMTRGNYDAAKLGGFYTRLSGSDSIEMTSAFLHANVRRLAGPKTALRDKQRLAAVMHLCGPNKGPALIRARYDAEALGRCGAQAVGAYVRVVMRQREQFARLAARERS